MFALDAKTGKIVWEFFLVPKVEGDIVRGPLGATPLDASKWKNAPGLPISGGGTWTSYTLDTKTGQLYVPGGNPAPDFVIGVREGDNSFTDSVVVLDAKTGDYKNHFQIVKKDWHDWDVSNPPILIQTMGGKQLMAVAPKDGYLYGFDLATKALLYRVPVTRVEDVKVPFTPGNDIHFCPGSVGGAEWNSPAYDPRTNLIMVGEVEWCDTVTLQSIDELRSIPVGQPWAGMATINPFNMFGKEDRTWAGWLHAVDADTGVWTWRREVQLPDHRRRDSDGRRRCVLRRYWRQLLCARFHQRAETLGSGFRRRDRRRRDHLYGERRPEGRRRGRLYHDCLANEGCESQGRGAGPRGRRHHEPMIVSYSAARLFVLWGVLINQRRLKYVTHQ